VLFASQRDGFSYKLQDTVLSSTPAARAYNARTAQQSGTKAEYEKGISNIWKNMKSIVSEKMKRRPSRATRRYAGRACAPASRPGARGLVHAPAYLGRPGASSAGRRGSRGPGTRRRARPGAAGRLAQTRECAQCAACAARPGGVKEVAAAGWARGAREKWKFAVVACRGESCSRPSECGGLHRMRESKNV